MKRYRAFLNGKELVEGDDITSWKGQPAVFYGVTDDRKIMAHIPDHLPFRHIYFQGVFPGVTVEENNGFD